MEAIFLTVDETAEYLNITKRQVFDMARRKELPAMKFGRHWGIHKEKLDKLIQQKTSFVV